MIPNSLLITSQSIQNYNRCHVMDNSKHGYLLTISCVIGFHWNRCCTIHPRTFAHSWDLFCYAVFLVVKWPQYWSCLPFCKIMCKTIRYVCSYSRQELKFQFRLESYFMCTNACIWCTHFILPFLCTKYTECVPVGSSAIRFRTTVTKESRYFTEPPPPKKKKKKKVRWVSYSLWF